MGSEPADQSIEGYSHRQYVELGSKTLSFWIFAKIVRTNSLYIVHKCDTFFISFSPFAKI